MSHNDYTKYAKEKVEHPVVEPAPVEIVETETPVVEPVVEPEVVEPVAEPEVVEPAKPEIEPEPVVEIPRKMGRVFGCSKLNVRKAPKPRAEIICEIELNSEVEIDEESSTVDFYKVCTASGVEGYCVKTYINKISEK